MLSRTIFVVALVTACKGGDPSPANKVASGSGSSTTAAPAGPSAACAAKVKDLEPWLVQMELERVSYEIDFGSVLQVIDREPYPVDQHVDNITITADDMAAYDVSEHNRVGSSLGKNAPQKAVVERLTKLRGMAAGSGDSHAAPDDHLRIDVDMKATWGDVARVLDAAAKAGYSEATFAFTATPKAAMPPGVDPQTKSEDDVKAAETRLEALMKACAPWRHAAYAEPGKSPGEDAVRLGHASAAGILECNCAADPDEIRAATWKQQRWHQARPRVGVMVKLTGDAPVTITLPPKTPWSEAHQKLLEAAPVGGPPPVIKAIAK